MALPKENNMIAHGLLTLLMGCAVMIGMISTPAAANEVYRGGTIITMVGDQPQIVEAIAVIDGKIVAVGTEKTAKKAAGPKTAIIDLKGKTLLPGFIDAHGHVAGYGQSVDMAQLAAPPLGTVNSIPALQQALLDYVQAGALSSGVPVFGIGYDDSQLAEKRHPTRVDLDAVFSDRPILISHTSGHLAVANSAMLKLLGISADSADPAGGKIRRENDGKTPNGVLEENAFFRSMGIITPKDIKVPVKALVHGEKLYTSYGITTAQDGRVMPEAWPVVKEAARLNLLPLDTVVLIAGERQWPAETTEMIGKHYVNNMRIAGIKLSLDGSPQGRTAWLVDPVPVPPDGQKAGYHGYGSMPDEELLAILKKAAANDWQVFAHVNGDAAAQQLIDGVRAAGLAGHRTIAIHNQVVTPAQLAEMKELDIQPSYFVSHSYYWGDWHRDVALGPKRADFISPLASALAAGLRPTLHNDSPVTPPDMMRLVWSAVNRRTQSGDILGPLERISPYDALKMITINAAWQIREDDKKGSIEPGKNADLVVLDANPLTAAADKIADIKILTTIRNGIVVYEPSQ